MRLRSVFIGLKKFVNNLEFVQAVRGQLSRSDGATQDFSNSDLRGKTFGTRDFSNCDFFDADLRDADLSKAKGLTASQLSGTNLTRCKLPEGLAFTQVENVKELSKNAGGLFLAVMLSCAFVLLTALSTRDIQLLVNTGQATLPVLNVAVPTVSFFFASPPLLVGAYIVLHLYLQRLWATLADLPAVFPDGIPVYSRTYPWLVTDLVRWGFPRLREIYEPLMNIQVVIFASVTYLTVPITVGVLTARCLVRHDKVLTAWHALCLGTCVGWAGLSFFLALLSLRRYARRRGPQRLRAYLWKLSVSVAIGVGALIAYSVQRGLYEFSGNIFVTVPANLSANQELRLQSLLSSDNTVSSYARSLDGEDSDGNPIRIDETLRRHARAAKNWNDDLISQIRRAQSAKSGMWASALNGSASIIEDQSMRPSGWTEPTGLYVERGRKSATSKSYEEGVRRQEQFAMDRLRAIVPVGGFRREKGPSNLEFLKARGAFLENADFRGADLKGADLAECDLRGARWKSEESRATLELAVLSLANLTSSDLSGCNLKGADLTGAILSGAKLDHVDLTGAVLKGTDFRGASFTETILIEASLEDALLAHARFKKTSLVGQSLSGDLHGVVFEECSLSGVQFGAANMRDASLVGADLSDCDLIGVDLTGANLSYATIGQKSLEETVLKNAVLIGAHMKGALFAETALDGAILDGADLRESDGSAATYDKAEYDTETRWPGGVPPHRWTRFERRGTGYDIMASGHYEILSLPPKYPEYPERFRLIKIVDWPKPASSQAPKAERKRKLKAVHPRGQAKLRPVLSGP